MSEILTKIKSRGYWEVVIRPTIFEEYLIKTPAKCKDLVRELQVRLRGWDFPYYPINNPPITGLDYIEQSLDWSYFLEYWRYYQNGMFVHFFGFIEDWQDQAIEGRMWQLPSSKSLTIISTLYRITEIFEFTSRLANKGLLGEECFISIRLHDTQNRTLVMLDERRRLWDDYICSIDEIPWEKNIKVEELISNSSKLSLDHTVWLFQRFNWDNPSYSVLKGDQEKLLKGYS